jgi:multidrug efflux pump subunit AcrB
MLMGIVSKNSILLVEYAMVGMQERSMPMVVAIVMTTVAMIAGMPPLSLGLGAVGRFRQPMRRAVIGTAIVCISFH